MSEFKTEKCEDSKKEVIIKEAMTKDITRKEKRKKRNNKRHELYLYCKVQ